MSVTRTEAATDVSTGPWPPPVRVCFVVENLLPAGTELWICRLIEQLDRRRVEPALCLIDGDNELSRGLEPVDCPILRLGLKHLKTRKTWTAARALASFLRRQRIDIVQVHHADPSYLAVPVARWVGVRAIVQTKYDVGYWLHGWDLRLHRWLRRWIDVTVANCEACRQAAVQQERAPLDQVVVVDNGIPMAPLLRIPALHAARFDGKIRIGMVANLRPVKDPQTLIRAAALLVPEFSELEFHLAGQGELLEPLRGLIAELRLERHVWLHGHVADTVGFWAATDIAVLCSRSEGLPHALLEAMAAGRAVVATRVGGNAELIADGQTGRLVPPADPGQLSMVIRELLQHPETAVSLAAASRRSVATRYSLTAMTQRFEAFYQSLMPPTS